METVVGDGLSDVAADFLEGLRGELIHAEDVDAIGNRNVGKGVNGVYGNINGQVAKIPGGS